jgi:hypothetical protein
LLISQPDWKVRKFWTKKSSEKTLLLLNPTAAPLVTLYNGSLTGDSAATTAD